MAGRIWSAGGREEKGAALLHATNPLLLCWTLGVGAAGAGELIFPPFNATIVSVPSDGWQMDHSRG